MNDRPISVSPSLTVRDFLEKYVYRQPRMVYPVVEDSRLVGCVRISDVKGVVSESRGTITVADILTPVSEENSVSPDRDATELLSGMLVPGVIDQRLVVKDGRLVGTISLQDLRMAMAIQMQIGSPEPR
jgi:CBS domain-containing protein